MSLLLGSLASEHQKLAGDPLPRNLLTIWGLTRALNSGSEMGNLSPELLLVEGGAGEDAKPLRCPRGSLSFFRRSLNFSTSTRD